MTKPETEIFVDVLTGTSTYYVMAQVVAQKAGCHCVCPVHEMIELQVEIESNMERVVVFCLRCGKKAIFFERRKELKI